MSLYAKTLTKTLTFLSGYKSLHQVHNSKSIGNELVSNISNSSARRHDKPQLDNIIDDFIWRIGAIVA